MKATSNSKMGKRMRGCLLIFAIVVTGLIGCVGRPAWHWEKQGAGDEQLTWDQNQCKARVYAGSAGAVTNETVRHMFACMESKGWSKVAD